MEHEARRELLWAVGLFAGALLLRGVHLLTILDSPFFSILYIDPAYYDEWALTIASGELLRSEPFFLDPLYPYFLGAIYAVFGHSYVAVAAVQGFLGALVAPLVMLAARPWFGTTVARLAGVMALLYLPSVYFGGLLMKPGLSLFLITLTLWLMSRALAGAGVRSWLLAGVVFGLAGLTRGNLLLLLPLLSIWVLARAADGEQPVDSFGSRVRDRRRWSQALALSAGAALVLALPATHNYVVGGELILSTANAGANFYIGNNPANESGEYQQLPFVKPNPKYEQEDFRREAQRRSGRSGMSNRAISRFWFAESWEWIRSEKIAWLGLMWHKLHSFWGAYEIPDSLDYYLYRTGAPVLRLPLPGFGLLAPLGLTGALLALGRRGWPRLLLWFTVLYSLSIVFFFVFSRFRMVIVPVLFVFAGFAVVELLRRWKRGRAAGGYAPAIAASALLVVCTVFVNLPVRAMGDGWGYRIASAIGIPTKLESSAQGRHNLGLAYARLAKDSADSERLLGLAEEQLREALRLDPPYATVHVELGKVLARQERNREAIEIYRQAAQIEPNAFHIHHALGLLHRRLGEWSEAEAAFRRALAMEPRHTASAVKLGEALLRLGRREGAAEAFRHALRVEPGNVTAEAGLRAATESR
jgi:4-amino-4-deoxy-L-arabinose transferase-like glycosyltransferase/predicted negative regulator of RcsB-dependent stress response